MKILVLLFTILFSSVTLSNVIITGTRIIYPSDADSVAVQLTNNSTTSSLVQSWIDNGDENSTPENSEAPFYLSPPIVKIEGLQGQQLKIKKTPEKIPENVESVFFLNVLDIPKTPESVKGKNAIQLATRSRIKIFYRPIGLTESPDEVINNASYHIKNNNIFVKNNSQYHLTIAAITPSDDKNNSLIDAAMISPMSEKELPIKGIIKNHEFILTYVDDYGVFKSKNIKL